MKNAGFLLDPAFRALNFWKKTHLLWEAASQLDLPVALYSFPGNTNVILQISLSPPMVVGPDLEGLEPGYLASRFNNDNSQHLEYFPAHLSLRSSSMQDVVLSESIDQVALGRFAAVVAQLRDSTMVELEDVVKCGSQSQDQRLTYLKLVEAAQEAIAQGHLQKVICSRTQQIKITQPSSPVAVYRRINDSYPHAFVSGMRLPGGVSWFGASPELLLYSEQANYFKTVALAGTQHILNNSDVFSAVWKEKEKEEQQLVVEYIKDCFDDLGVKNYEMNGPKTVPAGNLMHLCTDFVVYQQAEQLPGFSSKMLQMLHPTSAVCGMPREAAMQFINQHEGYDRAYYCGFIGPVNVDQVTSLYVNLRCMRMQGQEATLYAGAGITAESDAQAEWLETEFKTNTLLSVLQD